MCELAPFYSVLVALTFEVLLWSCLPEFKRKLSYTKSLAQAFNIIFLALLK